jgi:hypothetical protein
LNVLEHAKYGCEIEPLEEIKKCNVMENVLYGQIIKTV